MGKIKVESVDSKVFKLGGIPYLRGQYVLQYSEVNYGDDGLLTEDPKVMLTALNTQAGAVVRQPFKDFKPWTDFLDSAGDAYADFDAFALNLAGVISVSASGGSSAATFQDIYDLGSGSTEITDGTNTTFITPLNVQSISDLSGGGTAGVGISDASGANATFQVENIGGDIEASVSVNNSLGGSAKLSGDGTLVLKSNTGDTIIINADDVATNYTAKIPNKTGIQTFAMLSDLSAINGTFLTPTSITVVNGIITAIS
ncbi:MAG: hypothetical protein KBC56_07270 [Flavobacterium sp.]|nr:hypothetical protein [Flavobacterium sp.]